MPVGVFFRSQRTCRIRSLLLFCKMSPCSHWHSCLLLKRSRSVTTTQTVKSSCFSSFVICQHDTTSAPKWAVLWVNKRGCELTFLTFLFCSFHSLSLHRGISPCLWTVWQCWGSWEKGWVGPPQLEWFEDEGPHEAVEVKTKGKNSPRHPLEVGKKTATALIRSKCTHDKSKTTKC